MKKRLIVLHSVGAGDAEHVEDILDDRLGCDAQAQTRLHQFFIITFDAAGVIELVEVGRDIGDVLGDLGGVIVACGGDDLAVKGREQMDQLDLLGSAEQAQFILSAGACRDAF